MLRFSRVPSRAALFAGVLFAGVLGVMASSCGRSPLGSETSDSASTAAGGAGGAGGAGSATTASTTASMAASSTTGGAGGPTASCYELALTGEPITYEPTPSDHGSRPSLVSATEDGSLVSVVFSRASIKDPAPGFPRIAGAALSPWGSWPSSLGAGVQASSIGGDIFAVSPAMAAAQPGFSVLFYLPTGNFPSDMYFAPVASVGTAYDSFPVGTSWDSWEPAWPVALARGASSHLAAYELGMGSNATMSLALVDAGSLKVSVINEVACAKATFAAAAVPTSGGFLVATASGRSFGACPLGGIPGPATELQVIRLDEATQALSFGASFEGTDPIAHIELAKHDEGAWLAWQENGASSLLPPPIHAVPLDESGAPSGPIVNITQDGDTTGPFAAAALGARLVVAWIDSIDPSTPTIRLDLFDEEGAFVIGTSLNTSPSWLYGASLSLLASPDGEQLLVAWSDQDQPAPATVRVARFSCAFGEYI